MYKTLNPLKSLIAGISLLAANAAFAEDTSRGPTVLPECDVPLASVMVGKLQCKAANCNTGNAPSGNGGGLAMLMQLASSANNGQPNVSGITEGIKDVLVTALSETGCFDVQNREQMDEIAKELALAGKQFKPNQLII